MTDIDLGHLRQWIGRTEQASDAVTPRLVRGLLATLDRDAGDLADGQPAPLAIHWCLAPAIVPQSQLGPDGHPARGGFLPPVPLPRRMWAGGALEFVDVLRIGDCATRLSRIADVALKQGRSGALCFVTVEHEYATERGVALRERQDIVYRGGEAPSSKAEPKSDDRAAQWRRTIAADAVMLFRYSALTFNGHRIHYDRAYCRDIERYPGLVVHGPLQATLLLDLAAETQGSAPRRFEFRALRPLFDGIAFSLNATAEGEALKLWTADEHSHMAMSATADWT